jgi:hypothetical protein
LWNFLDLAQSSWNAGDRSVQCTIGTVNSSFVPTASTGSLKR